MLDYNEVTEVNWGFIFSNMQVNGEIKIKMTARVLFIVNAN